MSEVTDSHWSDVSRKIRNDGALEEKIVKWFTQCLAAQIMGAYTDEGVYWSYSDKCLRHEDQEDEKITDDLPTQWLMDVFVGVYCKVSYGSYPFDATILTALTISTT